MISVLKQRLVLISVLALSLRFCSAQISSGQYTFDFDQGTVPVYDLTGPIELSQDLVSAGGGTTPLVFTVPTVVHENSGRLRGSGLLMVTIGNDVVAANYTVSGSVSGGGENTRVVFSVRLSGTDVIAGKQRRFSGSLSYNLTVDPGAQTLSGTSKGSLSIAGVGSSKVAADSLMSPTLPNGVDGAWQVQVNVLALKKLGGTGTIVVSSYGAPDGSNWPAGRTIPTNLSGSYNSRTDLAKVQLTGTGDGRGNSLTVTFTPNSSDAKLSGKILGQTVRY